MAKAIQKSEVKSLFQLGLLLFAYSLIQGPIDSVVDNIALPGRIVFAIVIFILVLILFKFEG